MKWILFIFIGYYLYVQHNEIVILQSKVYSQGFIYNLHHQAQAAHTNQGASK